MADGSERSERCAPPPSLSLAARESGRELAREDDQIFPPLRLAPVSGETGLENMLRQIDALMQRPRIAALPPPEPAPRPSRPRAPPRRSPPQATPQRQAARRLRPEQAPLGAIAALLLACLLLYPANAPFFPSFAGAPPGRAALTVAIPPLPARSLSSPPLLPLPLLPVPLAESPAPAKALPAVSTASAGDSADLPSAALLLDRGNRLLAEGDIVSARQFFARAAAFDAAAAAGMGKTYDPGFLRQIGAIGMRPDAERAAAWYREAAASGDAEAASLLARLGSGGEAPRGN